MSHREYDGRPSGRRDVGGARRLGNRAGNFNPAGAALPKKVPRLGRYGLSAFYARSDDEVLDLAEDRLDQFETLFTYRIGDLIDAGFEVVPTYRSPHVTTIAFYDEPDVAVHRLLAVDHRVLPNPAYRKDAQP